jgi:uncharacterized protein (DUF302 family)
MGTVKSPHSAKATREKFGAGAKEKGLNMFARIDHATGATKLRKTLRPTEVLIFGNRAARHAVHGVLAIGRH